MKTSSHDTAGLGSPTLSPTKRISIASSQRLQDIMGESSSPAAPSTPPVPPRSTLRESASMNPLPLHSASSPTWPLGDMQQSESTQRSSPPGYDWVTDPVSDQDDNISNGPVEGEKLAALRQSGGFQRKQRTRGGWGRMCLIAGIVALVVIGLAVGLGVGLTVGRRKGKHDGENEETPGPAGNSVGESQSFPVGQHSIATTLRIVNTDCTSNPNTWSCFPYTTYNPQNPASFNASQTEFHWIISNTSSTYATNGSTTTPDTGIPANLTISTTDNPLSITFSNKSLTYYNPASNSSAERYTFSFSMAKSVIPDVDISGNNTQSQCWFNQTTFTGSLYLTAPSTYSGNTTTINSDAGETPWPFAIEVSQTSPGGYQSGEEITPTCYSYINGRDGAMLDAGLSAQPANSQCECGYINF